MMIPKKVANMPGGPAPMDPMMGGAALPPSGMGGMMGKPPMAKRKPVAAPKKAVKKSGRGR